jgi:hypothetical protein
MENKGGPTMEQQQGLPTVTIMHLEGFGVGSVEPTSEYSDEQVERNVAESQASVADEAIVCVDDRPAAGETKEPVRRKTSGGVLASTYAGALLANASLYEQFKGGDGNYTASPKEMLSFTAQFLVKSGLKLGAHTDNHAHGDKTNCGAADGLAPAIAEIPQYAEELNPVVAALSGEDWDAEGEAMFVEIISTAQRLTESGYLENYRSTDVLDIVRANGGVVEVLDADARSEEPERHGHLAEAVGYNTVIGRSNNRDKTKMMAFQLDKEAVDVPSDKTGRNDYERQKLRIAINVYNAAIVRRLTKNPRVVVVS